MSGTTRRDWLKGCAAALTLASVPWWRRMAHAQGQEQARNLLLVFVDGGWDTSACVDPKVGLSTVDSAPGDVQLFGNLDVLTGPQRPAVARFFGDFGDQAAIVRGIQVRSIAHEECTKRIFTGTNQDDSPDMGAIAGVHNGPELPLPYMILGQNAFAGPYGGSTGRAGTAGQLVTLLHPDASYGRQLGGTRRFDGDASEEDLIRRFVQARAQRDKALRSGDGRNARKFNDLIRSIERRDQVKRLLNGGAELTTQLEFTAQAQMAARVFKQDISRAALIQHDAEWDTHADNHNRQMANLEALFSGLHFLVTHFMEQGLWENTTVAVISEMSRTPQLNDDMGKDHWPVTSALLLGAGIQGNRVYGGTDDQMQALPVDMSTGLVSQSGQDLAASSFASGVLRAVGVDPTPWFPDAHPLLAISG